MQDERTAAGAQAELALDGQPDRLTAWNPLDFPVAEGWRPVLERYLDSDQGRSLSAFLRERIAQGAVIYPPQPLRALELTPPDRVHAVVLGQDPYHGPGQAEGLAFSVRQGVRLPPSLRNIFKEAGATPAHGSLLEWARNGVLLLNACLTVEQGAAASHARKGWEAFTDAVLAHVAARATPCVYFLWGAHAQAKAPLIEREAAGHGRDFLILQSNHPSPLSAMRPPQPFLGCGHFRIARAWLDARGVRAMF